MHSDKHPPQISVLMPVYNSEEHLLEAIESVLSQTFTDFELLIIDDGSTDSSAQIVEEIARTDSRIKFFSRENRSITPTLNELVGLSRAPYLARMDADDICLPDRFQRQLSFMKENPQVGVLGGYAHYIDHAGRDIMTVILPTTHDLIDQKNCQGHAAMIHPAVMIRSSSLIQVGLYDERFRFAQDLDLWLRLAECSTLANLDVPVLKFRLANNSISATHAETQHEQARLACQAAWARRGLREMKFKETLWRPTSDRRSRHDFALKWAWQAWSAGNHQTAVFYFLRALKIMPWSGTAWKALVTGGLRIAPKSLRE